MCFLQASLRAETKQSQLCTEPDAWPGAGASLWESSAAGLGLLPSNQVCPPSAFRSGLAGLLACTFVSNSQLVYILKSNGGFDRQCPETVSRLTGGESLQTKIGSSSWTCGNSLNVASQLSQSHMLSHASHVMIVQHTELKPPSLQQGAAA